MIWCMTEVEVCARLFWPIKEDRDGGACGGERYVQSPFRISAERAFQVVLCARLVL